MAASAVFASVASAGPLLEEAQDCEDQRLSQPFLPWLDHMTYTPVLDGAVERGAEGWKLQGEARAVQGNEPWRVAGANDTRSLAIPEGSSATTSAICVGLEEPTLRFFAREAGGELGYLRVEVLYEDALGTVRAERVGVDVGGDWHPSAVMPIRVNLLPLLPGDQTAVAFRFTAVDGDFRVDDVYVDPWCQR